MGYAYPESEKVNRSRLLPNEPADFNRHISDLIFLSPPANTGGDLRLPGHF